MKLTPEQDRAVQEMVELAASMLGKGRAVHPETAIAATAWLAGSLLLRSLNLRLPSDEPGTVVLSNEANQKMPRLATLLAAFLSGSGITLDQSKLGGDRALRGAPPRLNFIGALSVLQAPALAIVDAHRLSYDQAADAAAIATAFVVKESAAAIGAETGANLAMYCFIEGSKTLPPHSETHPLTVGARTKPWYRFW
ncbi:MAG: hypothetical protein ACXU8N_10635 [Telluria sp.]